MFWLPVWPDPLLDSKRSLNIPPGLIIVCLWQAETFLHLPSPICQSLHCQMCCSEIASQSFCISDKCDLVLFLSFDSSALLLLFNVETTHCNVNPIITFTKKKGEEVGRERKRKKERERVFLPCHTCKKIKSKCYKSLVYISQKQTL